VKITYISSFNAKDITSYSGTGYYIPYKLQQAGDKVSFIGNLSRINPLSQKVKRKIYALMGKNYLIERSPWVLKLWAMEVNKQHDPASDVLVGYSSQPFSRLDINKPMVFWSDAVFANMVDYYGVYSNLCKESIKDGNKMEQEAINNVSLAVFSSHWAASAAKKYYGAPDSKIRVIPYGTNIEVNHSLDDIKRRATAKSDEQCNLLFLGVEWQRKGGDMAVKIAEDLNQKNIRAKLWIAGADPGAEIKKLPYIKYFGFLNKSKQHDLELLNRLISDSHFLVLPTRADCTPMVFSELNAHGIPVITTDEGGIPTIVRNGINGFMLKKDSPAEEFSGRIIEYFTDKKKYSELSASSFNEYKTRLNWQTSIRKFRNALMEII
jgi:glycosyltransferase involved in cell wall biosynthesis